MNELELVLYENDDAVTAYLGDISVADFRKHIDELLKKYCDKGAIISAIQNLQKFIN